MLVVKELDRNKALKKSEVHQTLIEHFNNYFSMTFGSDEERNEEKSFRLASRLFRLSPTFYSKAKNFLILK